MIYWHFTWHFCLEIVSTLVFLLLICENKVCIVLFNHYQREICVLIKKTNDTKAASFSHLNSIDLINFCSSWKDCGRNLKRSFLFVCFLCFDRSHKFQKASFFSFSNSICMNPRSKMFLAKVSIHCNCEPYICYRKIIIILLE